MEKARLTSEQKKWFEDEFEKLINKSSEEVIKLWNLNPVINWFPVIDEPILPDGIEKKLKGKTADEYVTLWNKLNDRRF